MALATTLKQRGGVDELDRLRHQVATLEQLLEVYQQTAIEQSTRLQGLLEERTRAENELQKHKTHLEEIVGERTAELMRANAQLKVDIAARKTAEQELALKAQELARSNEELERFAYVASHDLQEPLRMVASYTQLLARRYKGKLDGDADDFIGFAVDGASRMQQLIQDLLSYSRVTTRGGTLRLTESQTACANAVKNLTKAIQDSNARLTVGRLPRVVADDTQLTQLFQNLTGNAIKYRLKDRSPEISVTVKEDATHWIFSVQDNGIGIEPQYFDRIFQMFQRLHTRNEYSGTGIGLAICRKIVERHGGRIWVESLHGQGSTFFFTMPKYGGAKP